jgi:hypothetical protein
MVKKKIIPLKEREGFKKGEEIYQEQRRKYRKLVRSSVANPKSKIVINSNTACDVEADQKRQDFIEVKKFKKTLSKKESKIVNAFSRDCRDGVNETWVRDERPIFKKTDLPSKSDIQNN